MLDCVSGVGVYTFLGDRQQQQSHDFAAHNSSEATPARLSPLAFAKHAKSESRVGQFIHIHASTSGTRRTAESTQTGHVELDQQWHLLEHQRHHIVQQSELILQGQTQTIQNNRSRPQRRRRGQRQRRSGESHPRDDRPASHRTGLNPI